LKEVIKAAFEDQKYNKNGNIVKYEYNLKLLTACQCILAE